MYVCMYVCMYVYIYIYNLLPLSKKWSIPSSRWYVYFIHVFYICYMFSAYMCNIYIILSDTIYRNLPMSKCL